MIEYFLSHHFNNLINYKWVQYVQFNMQIRTITMVSNLRIFQSQKVKLNKIHLL